MVLDAVGEVAGDGSAAGCGWVAAGVVLSGAAVKDRVAAEVEEEEVVAVEGASVRGLDDLALAPFSFTGQSFLTWAVLEHTKQRPALGALPHS